MIEVPIFHVNGDDPEAVVYVGELALDFRETFGQDVVIDMVCYRRHGHNEGDEPAFTQPLMYGKIRDRITIRELYTEQLVMAGELSTDEAETIAETFRDKMEEKYDEVHGGKDNPVPVQPGFGGTWTGLLPQLLVRAGRDRRPVRDLAADRRGDWHGARRVPSATRRSSGIFAAGARRCESRGAIDWASGESLAFGSLLLENTPVRAQRPGQPAGDVQPAARRTWSTCRPARATSRSRTWLPSRPRSASTTACCPKPPCSGSTTATRSTSPTCSSSGRRSSATSPTAPR